MENPDPTTWQAIRATIGGLMFASIQLGMSFVMVWMVYAALSGHEEDMKVSITAFFGIGIVAFLSWLSLVSEPHTTFSLCVWVLTAVAWLALIFAALYKCFRRP